MNKRRYIAIVGIVGAAMLLVVSSCTTPTGHSPTIISLEAEPERVLPSGSCQIVCNATDADGDELSYTWSASGGEINGQGAQVTWAAPNCVGSCNVTVTVIDGRGGEVMESVTLEVRLNEPPTIAGLIADATWTTPSGSLQLTCDASDPDGDELTYEWTTTGGDVSSTGAVVEWTAPDDVGMFDITVVATDGHGTTDTRTLSINVRMGPPPIIEDLFITKDRYGHCYLRKYSDGYYVGKGQKYDIECIVTDVGIELVYEWSCDGGELSGEGSLITWTAPDTSLYVTVIATVSDITGYMASKDMILYVVPCSACTFDFVCAG